MHPTLRTLEDKGVPFVLFRYPDTKTIHCFYQNDNKTHTTNSFKDEGFIFAPFDFKDYAFNIPSTHQFTLELPEVLSSSTASIVLPSSGKANLIAKVNLAKEKITSNTFDKLVVSHRFELSYNEKSSAVFFRLAERYSNAFVYYWSHPETGDWLGATPEHFVELDKHILTTDALAGTLPANATQEDWTSKEFNEQQLVTDSILSALASVTENASIDQYPRETIQAGQLQHLRTKITVSSDNIQLKKVIKALHPTPAVGGIPKQESMQYLQQIEGYDRAFYTGFLGVINGTHYANLFVNLRCAKIENDRIYLYAGAGITHDSVAEDEWEEIFRKATTFLQVM